MEGVMTTLNRTLFFFGCFVLGMFVQGWLR